MVPARGPDAALRSTLERVGWRDVPVAEDATRLDRPGMGLTLNGVVRSFAADRVVAALVRGEAAGRALVARAARPAS